ncbi:unnamed protein product [Paramecium pentaurelia]|uniref:Uncharacterized protein n=1 Tax=Paramecium pentaurelia TaxID=43138 RepID=A0A8S1VQD7_9CILI|nr:unnamed protein product [Paramecium pentaurelia]
MIDKDIKMKSLKLELEKTLETRINQNVYILQQIYNKIGIHYISKIKFLLKKTKASEKLRKENLNNYLSRIKMSIQLLRLNWNQLINSWSINSIKILQLDCNDIKLIKEKFIYNNNLMNLEKDKLQNQVKDLEEDKKQMQKTLQDLRNKQNKELETLREQIHSYQNEKVQIKRMNEEQMRNLSKLEQQMENKDQNNDEEIDHVKRKKDQFLCQNDSNSVLLIIQQNKKGRLNEIEFLKKQVQELQTELVLLKEFHKTAQSSLKSKMEQAGYFKGRLKKLDIENQELLDSKIRQRVQFNNFWKQQNLKRFKDSNQIFQKLDDRI